MENKFPTKKVIMGVITFLILVVLYSSFQVVSPGQRGIRITMGAVQEGILDEGFHFKLPFIQSIKCIDVTVQKHEVESDAASKDLQNVYATIALNYHLDTSKVNSIYQSFRGDELELLIVPALEESTKAATAQYTAEELITNREAVKDVMVTEIENRVNSYGITVDAISIVNFSFSASFSEAIENKVTAEQDALTAENKLAQVEFEADQKIAEATGEAEAIRIQAEAIQSQGGAEYLQLQWINK